MWWRYAILITILIVALGVGTLLAYISTQGSSGTANQAPSATPVESAQTAVAQVAQLRATVAALKASQATNTKTPLPTSTPRPTATPLPPAQQLAFLATGHRVSPVRPIVKAFRKDLNTIQKLCTEHQFQIVDDLKRTINQGGHKDTLAAVADRYAQYLVNQQTPSEALHMSCVDESSQYANLRVGGHTLADLYRQESQTPTPIPTDTPVPTDTPTPKPTAFGADAGYVPYQSVADHTADYVGTKVSWTCVIANFLADDADGNAQVGCWEYVGAFDGISGEGEVILLAPYGVDVSTMDKGDNLQIVGTVAGAWQGTNGFGAAITLPAVTLIAAVDRTTGTTTY